MSSQLENNNTLIQEIAELINSLQGVSVTSVNNKTGKVVLTVSDIENAASAVHEHSAQDVTGGMFSGEITANGSYQTASKALLRNSTLATTATTPTNDGEICWVYE